MLKRAAIVYLVLSGCAFHARAQGIYTTAISITPDFVFPGALGLNGFFEPGVPGVFGYGFSIYTIDPDLTLLFKGASLGGVSPIFSPVNEGSILDRAHLVFQNGNAGMLGPPLSGFQMTLNQPFLIGMHLVNGSGGPGLIVTDERFGWARLEYTATGLQILDQATALGGNGIIAGTTTVLPEPSTLSLIGIGAAGLLCAHRRLKSRRAEPPVG